MIVLDTNIVSELMQVEPDRMPSGRRRTRIASAIADMLEIDFADRILPFDVSSSLEYGRVVAHREQLGHPIGMADAMIAATARSAGASLFATRNTKDFADTDLPLINPWISR